MTSAVSQTKPAAPVNEIGYAQAPNYNWWQYQDETTPELQWPQSISVYDAMRRTDAQVTSVLRAMTLPVRSTPWRVDPNGASDEVTEFVADNLGLPIVGQEPKAPLRQQDRFSWDEHLRQALLMLPFGHMYFEQVYRVDPDGKARLRKLGPRMPKTIEKIDVADDGGLISITQWWTRTDREPRPIPVNRLVAYIHEKEGGNWLGSSILRPGYKNWLLKDRLLRVWAQTIERNGMGVPRYTGAEGEASLTQGLAMARAWRSGESAGTAIPHGALLDLVGVNGTLPDAEPAVRYHDEQLGRAVLAHFLNLGTQTGSWALGTTFADFFTLSLQSLAQQVQQTGSLYIIEDLVDINWGPDEPAPRLICDEIGSRQPATAQSLVALFGAGALTPDDRLEESLRQQYGLPPRDPDTARTPPGAAPVMAGGVGPKAPVVAKFNPAEPRIGSGEHGGEWTTGGVLKDVLKLAGRIELDDGETLAGSDKLKADFGTVRIAAVDRGGKRSLRLGIGAEGFGSRDDEVGPWSGGRDRSQAINDERAPLRAERDALETGPETPENARRYDELDDMDLSEVYPLGYTANLDAAGAAQLRDVLADANVRARVALAEVQVAWDAIPDGTQFHPDTFPVPYIEVAAGSIPAGWGDVHFHVEVEEPASGPRTHLWVVPDGMTSEEVADADNRASLDAAESARLVRLLDKMTGKVTAARDLPDDPNFNSKHPRGRGGRFVTTFQRVTNALEKWSKGDGKDDPLPESDFTREQLRDVAKKRGITLQRGASREHIRDALLDDLKVKVRTDRENPAPKPSAKFTLKSGKLRNKDVAVYQEANGKVSLYEESDAGKRGARVALADDLAGLETWADEHGEPELAAWARKEGGGAPKAPAKKAAPAKKTTTRAGGRVADYSGNYAARQDSLRSVQGEPEITALPGGVSSKVELLTYPDGTRVVRKDYASRTPSEFDRVPADAEELAARVLDAFGVPTPAVIRRDDHTVDMEYVDGVQGGKTGVLKAPTSVTTSEQGRRLGLADAVMGHRDRAGGNWMKVDDGIVPIDNGNAFEGMGNDTAAAGNPFVSYLMTQDAWKRDVDVDRDELAAIRQRLVALRPEFDRLGRTQQHEYMLARLDEIDSRAVRRARTTEAPNKATPAKKAAPAAPAKPDVDSLRAMDTEARRDALDLHTIPELKALMPAGMKKTGKKRELVDRLTEHLSAMKGVAS